METVYRLTSDDLDLRFWGFHFPKIAPSCLGNAHVRDDFRDVDGHKLTWYRRSLMNVWKPVKVVGRVRPFNDYPEIEMKLPVFSVRAVNALRKFLEPNGELLPVVSDVGTYFIFNVLTKSDVFVRSESDADFGSEGEIEVALRVRRFVFRPETVRELSIFRVREYPYLTLVTQRFKDEAESAGLNGLCFDKLWPLPEASVWEKEANRERHNRDTAAGKPMVDMQGQCMIIKMKAPGRKVTTSEVAQAKQIADDIGRFLSYEQSLDDPYMGMVEDIRTMAREIRIYVSGPNVDTLVDFLRPLLDNMSWPHEIELVRRYGNILDNTAKQSSDTVVGERMTATAMDLPKDVAADLRLLINVGLAECGWAKQSNSDIVEQIDALINIGRNDPDELAVRFPGVAVQRSLAAVLGQLYVKDCGWNWKWIEFRNSRSCFYELAVVSPDESLMLCPESAIERLIEDSDYDSNVALTFNLIRGGKLPTSLPRSLSRIM